MFSQQLDRVAQLVEHRLGEAFMSLAGRGTPDRLVDAIRHAALGGGKRLRPYLVVESAGIFGVEAEHALTTAAALECVHCYSLVHDDLPAMDNDDLRRGKPTVHKAFDEWTAILAGDALLTLAFELLAQPEAHPDATVRATLIASLAGAAGACGMVGGQALDLAADKLGLPVAPDLAHVQRLQAMKTGALIAYACTAGAILGRGPPPARQALATYGEQLGAAFQIADDLLDAEGDPAVVGKATRKDAGKATLVSVLGVKAARDRLADLETGAHAALRSFGPEADGLRAAAAFVVRRQN